MFDARLLNSYHVLLNFSEAVLGPGAQPPEPEHFAFALRGGRANLTDVRLTERLRAAPPPGPLGAEAGTRRRASEASSTTPAGWALGASTAELAGGLDALDQHGFLGVTFELVLADRPSGGEVLTVTAEAGALLGIASGRSNAEHSRELRLLEVAVPPDEGAREPPAGRDARPEGRPLSSSPTGKQSHERERGGALRDAALRAAPVAARAEPATEFHCDEQQRLVGVLWLLLAAGVGLGACQAADSALRERERALAAARLPPAAPSASAHANAE